jgi:hypothetical protein
MKCGECRCVHGARGKSDGERGRNDLQVGHMTLLPECARSHIRYDRSHLCMSACVCCDAFVRLRSHSKIAIDRNYA